MRRRALLSLIAFVVVIVVLIGARYQWARAHRSVRTAATTSQQDSVRRDSLANERDPGDTLCFASKLGLPCDQH
ncbi:MAG TPA: hypothetical protein VFP26_00870 [Gemmatimonadaceae bacterium]|nr:hypothetical protein [Gemmatimonadaceae bacterium]